MLLFLLESTFSLLGSMFLKQKLWDVLYHSPADERVQLQGHTVRHHMLQLVALLDRNGLVEILLEVPLWLVQMPSVVEGPRTTWFVYEVSCIKVSE